MSGRSDKFLVATVVFFSFFTSSTQLLDYCAIKCSGEKHTMCKYKVCPKIVTDSFQYMLKGPSSSCVDLKVTYDANNMAVVVHLHNDARNLLAKGQLPNVSLPEASDMRLMVWDPELATIAHRWLSQCVKEHDTCRDTTEEMVGQNIGFLYDDEIAGSPMDLLTMFNRWAHDESFHLTEEDVAQFSKEKTDIHEVSQIFWAASHKLGCSEVTYRAENREIKAIACNYAPKGNLVGQPMYEAGHNCSKCPRGTECDMHPTYLSLCGTKDEVLQLEDFDLHDLGKSSNPRQPGPMLPIITACTFHKLFIVLRSY